MTMMRATSTSIPASSASKSSAATSSATRRHASDSRLYEAERLATWLIAAKRLVDAASELLLQALLLADGRLGSFHEIAEARMAAERASWRLQRELDALSGVDRWVRRVIEEALEVRVDG